METTKRTTSRVIQVTESREVETRPVEGTDFHLYRATINRETTTRGAREVTKTIVFEGVATEQMIDTFLTTAQVTMHSHATVLRDGNQSAIVAVRPEALEALRQYGWCDWGLDAKKPRGIQAPDFILKAPLTAVEKGEPVVVFEMYGAAHRAYTLDGTPLPVCTFFGYTPGYMAADRYDLEKAIEILKARSDIRFVSPGTRGRSGDKSALTHFSYGHGPDHLVFHWIPETETYLTVHAQAMTYRAGEGKGFAGTDMARAVFDLDTFGLRAGGAAKFDSFWEYEKPWTDEDEPED